MTWLWLLLFVVVAAVLVWILILRPMAKQMPALSAAFAAEASAVEKIQARITGWKTKIFSRLIAIGGMLVALYDHVLPAVTGQDWTPLTQQLPAWSLPVGLFLLTMVLEWLRSATSNAPQIVTQNIDGEKQVVAVVQPPKV